MTQNSWSTLYVSCPACSNNTKGYWHHPGGGDKCYFVDTIPSKGFIVQIKQQTIRCDGCQTEKDISQWKFSCNNHKNVFLPFNRYHFRIHTYNQILYEQKYNDNSNNNSKDVSKVYSLQYSNKNLNKYGLKKYLFKIRNQSDLCLNSKIKSKGIKDESGYNVVPISKSPVLSFHLNLSYYSWTNQKQKQFLQNLADELNVNAHDLSIICSSQGSINVSVLINAVKTKFGNTPITCAYVEDKRKTLKYSNKMKPYCIQSTKIESWFDSEDKQNDTKEKFESFDLNDDPTATDHLTATEKWFLDQTTSLRTSLRQALSKLKQEFSVEAICILDNDEALNKFIVHPNLGNSKLLFHGTAKEDLGSIFREGLNHGGGAVYGHGSYLTSSPLHSIYYMLNYKKGYYPSSKKFTLIAAYVNCGRIKEIYNTSYNQKDIQYPYDSHHISVTASSSNSKYLGYPLSRIKSMYDITYTGETADEYAIKNKTRILPRFLITLKKSNINKVVVWRDRYIYSAEQEKMIDNLCKNKVSVYSVKTTSEAMKIIKVKKEKNKLMVVTYNRDYAESFAKQTIAATNNKTQIIVRCGDNEANWVDGYDQVNRANKNSLLLCIIIWWFVGLSLNICNIL